MFTLRWSYEQMSVDTVEMVVEIINKLNLEYTEKTPIFAQVENAHGDVMCIGIGNREGHSFIDYLPADESPSKHAAGENEGDELVSFFMGDDESEFCISQTVKYQSALKALNTFLADSTLDSSMEWIDD